MTYLEWKRDPMMDSLEAITPVGRYVCVRTWADSSKLYRNGELLGVWTTGSHTEARSFALKDYTERTALDRAGS